MITLTFVPEECALHDDLASDPAAADPSALSETYFVMPVEFAIDEVELLPRVRAGGMPRNMPGGTVLMPQDRQALIPLVGFAAELLEAVTSMQPGSSHSCRLGEAGRIHLDRHDDTFRVSSSITSAAVEVGAMELQLAARDFAGRVRDFLQARVPGISAHPSWKGWFGT